MARCCKCGKEVVVAKVVCGECAKARLPEGMTIERAAAELERLKDFCESCLGQYDRFDTSSERKIWQVDIDALAYAIEVLRNRAK